MGVELNHIVIWAKDKWASAEFLARVLGIQAGPQWERFVPVRTSNGVTIDYAEAADIGVLIQNLNPDVSMMEPAEDRYRCDAAERLGPPKIWSIFIQ